MVQSQFLSANFIHEMFSGPAETVTALKGPKPKRKVPINSIS